VPLSESQWAEAEESRDVVTLLHGFLDARKPTAYSVEEILDEAESGVESGSSSTWEVVGAVVGAQADDTRYELALESLVYEGKVEKRTVRENGVAVDYYRAV
jgi:hypothetical protein